MLRALHGALRDPDERLAAETFLAIASTRLRGHLGDRTDMAVARPDDAVASDLRDLLDEHPFDPLTLKEAGRILHVSPAHLVRCFTRSFAIAPHRYLLARRIDAARRRLLDGEPIAQVATSVGFQRSSASHPALQKSCRYDAGPLRVIEGLRGPRGGTWR
jgi:AraC-like DNA-binding protein